MKTILSVILILTGFSLFAQPTWIVVKYTNNTTAYGIVKINGNPANTGDRVGAFVGTECRANEVVILPGDGNAYVSMQIQGEVPETVSFKVWDASENSILDVALAVQSSPGNTIGYPDYLQINAVGKLLNVSPSNQNASSSSGSTKFNIECNTNWTVSDDADWLTVSPTTGLNNDTIIATYEANTECSSRTATITITATGATGSPKTVTISQSGTPVSVSDFEDKQNMKVYPNPFNNFITIENYVKGSRVLVTNILGESTIDILFPKQTINTEKLPDGVYVITLIGEEGVLKSLKMIKNSN